MTQSMAQTNDVYFSVFTFCSLHSSNLFRCVRFNNSRSCDVHKRIFGMFIVWPTNSVCNLRRLQQCLVLEFHAYYTIVHAHFQCDGSEMYGRFSSISYQLIIERKGLGFLFDNEGLA